MNELAEKKLSQFGKAYHGRMDSSMSSTGGSFALALKEAFFKASPSNREKIARAFPEYFNSMDIRLDYKIEALKPLDQIDKETGMVAAVISDHHMKAVYAKSRGYIDACDKIAKLAVEFESKYRDADWEAMFHTDLQPEEAMNQICWDDLVSAWSFNKIEKL